MNQMQTQVLEFHTKYGCSRSTIPTVMSIDERLRRIRLISEELSEFIGAATKSNLVEMVDAIGDLLYVTFGTAVAMGVDMSPIVTEIHRSNMTKEIMMDVGGKIIKGEKYEAPKLREAIDRQIK